MQPKITEPLTSGILTFENRAERYSKFIHDLDKKRFTTGLPAIDRVIRGVAPGEVMTIIAYSGAYKSALLQNLLMQAGAKMQQHQLFFSMEMPVETIFEREIQMANEVDGYTVESTYKAKDDRAAQLHSKAYSFGGKYLLTCEKNRLDLDMIRRYTQMAEVKYDSIGCVGIDYLGLMKADGKNLLEKTAEISYGVKVLAKELNLPVIILCQVSRAYATSKDAGIETDAAKGGGDIEAGADYMLGMFKHNESLIMRVLKNRKGRSGMYFKVDIDVESMRFFGVEPWDPPKKTKGKECNPYE